MAPPQRGDERHHRTPAPPAVDEIRAAEAAALRILGGAPQSAATLGSRLERRGFDADISATVVERMRSFGYIDDGELARSAVARAQRLGRGRLRLAADLRSRGIARELISQTMAEVDNEREDAAAVAAARTLAVRIRSGARPHPAQRLAAALQRRGFAATSVTKAVRLVTDEEEDLGAAVDAD